MRKFNRRYLPAFTLAFVSIVAAGCSSNPLAPEEKNLYDGNWVAQISKTTSSQRLAGWRLKCSNMQGELAFEVINGVMEIKLLDEVVQLPLLAEGKFRVKEVSNYHASQSSSSSIRIFDGSVTNILHGKLEGNNPKGRLSNWVQEVGAGCTTKVKFVRVGNTKSTQAATSLQSQFDNFRMQAGRNTGTVQ